MIKFASSIGGKYIYISLKFELLVTLSYDLENSALYALTVIKIKKIPPYVQN